MGWLGRADGNCELIMLDLMVFERETRRGYRFDGTIIISQATIENFWQQGIRRQKAAGCTTTSAERDCCISPGNSMRHGGNRYDKIRKSRPWAVANKFQVKIRKKKKEKKNTDRSRARTDSL